MARVWQSISEAEAKQHPIYGVKGWLLFFSIASVFGLLKDLGSANKLALDVGLSLGAMLSIDHPAVAFLKCILIMEFAVVAILIGMLIYKPREFRIIALWIMLLQAPLIIIFHLIYPDPQLTSTVVLQLMVWAISCAIWCPYLHLSKRVRVTFEHTILANNVPVASPSIKVTPSAPSPATTPASVTELATPMSATFDPKITTNFETPIASEEQLWADALSEFESPNRRAGLWAKSFTQSNGNDAQAKAAYLDTRVRELIDEQRKVAAETELRRQEEAEQERIRQHRENMRAFDALPKGICPNCGKTQLLSAAECSSCKAVFGAGSAWKLKPLS